MSEIIDDFEDGFQTNPSAVEATFRRDTILSHPRVPDEP